MEYFEENPHITFFNFRGEVKLDYKIIKQTHKNLENFKEGK